MTSQYFRSRLSSLREYLTPITHTSTFATTGEITPEEFVLAGDYLVHRFPTWQWAPVTDESKRKSFLPDDKQFLVTRHVPSYVRAADYEFDDNDNDADFTDKDNDKDNVNDEEQWSLTGSQKAPIIDNVDESSIKEISSDDEDGLLDIDELIDEEAEDVQFIDTKPRENQGGSHNSQLKKRYYDLYISYSTSYRVPKMYLVGFNSDSIPLSPQQMFEDIASDYRHKTVTIEKLPFATNTTSVSIHPCKHANVMKVLMKRAAAAANEKWHEQELQTAVLKKISKLGINDDTPKSQEDTEGDVEEWEGVDAEELGSSDESERTGIRVDQYLVVFLKFISSVIPGIEHDYTMDAL